MEDIPMKIRSTETFTDTHMRQSVSQSPPPTGSIADIDLSGFFSKSESTDINTVDSLTALSLLDSMLTRLLEWTSSGEPMTSTDSLDTDCSNSNEEDSPLSPKKRRRSNDNANDSPTILRTSKTPELKPEDNDGTTANDISPTRKTLQDSHLAQRFSLSEDPGITITDYLNRINKYCRLSTAVYLAAAYYIHKLVVDWEYIKLTNLNVHRLVIAALRLACKTLEDINHRQQFIAKMGGIKLKDLHSLEISFLFLMKFNCQVDCKTLDNTVNTIKSLYYKQNNTTSITN